MVDKRLDPTANAIDSNSATAPFRAFATAMVRASDYMILFDDQGGILELSGDVAELLGGTPESLVGRHLGNRLAASPFSFKALLFSLKHPQVSDKRSIRWRTTIQGPEGENRHLELNISRPQWADLPVFLALVSDITLAYRLEQQLDYRETTYKELYRKAPVMLHSIDSQGRLISVSERWLEVLGYREDEVIGRSSTDFLTDTSRRFAIEQVLPRYRREGKVTNVPYQFRCKNGEVLDVLLSAITETDPDGNSHRSMAVLIDVTELNRTEQERRRLESQVFRLQKLESLEVMAAGAAHDFNNILTVILGNLTLAESEVLKVPELAERLRDIEQAALRAGDICSQMLAYSGHGQRQEKDIDLSEIVRDMVAMLKISISKKAVVRLDLQDNLEVVRGDPTQIRQVLMNLLLNAADAIGDRGGRIEVRTGSLWCDVDDLPANDGMEPLPAGLFTFVEVEDDGCGMDATTVSRLFDPFYTTKATGRGLGMAVVFGHVRGHHGTVEVQSAVGQGTRIRVFLPSAERRPAPDEKPRRSSSPSSTPGVFPTKSA